MNNFVVYIISHNRPRCDTYYKLKMLGYTGRINIIIDNKDKYIDQYLKLYGDCIKIFDKDKIDIDLMDNLEEPKGIATYSREYCMQLAKQENEDYILMLDDDLKDIRYRVGKSDSKRVSNLDKILKECIDFIDNTNIDILTFGTENDYIGGKGGEFKIGRGTNAYLIKVKSDIHFKGRYAEDRIMPVYYSTIGKLIFKILRIQVIFDVWQPHKKTSTGGCNDIYKDENNYMMSFYPVISNPGCSFIKRKNNKYMASSNYKNICPKILSNKYKK